MAVIDAAPFITQLIHQIVQVMIGAVDVEPVENGTLLGRQYGEAPVDAFLSGAAVGQDGLQVRPLGAKGDALLQVLLLGKFLGARRRSMSRCSGLSFR